MIEDNIMARKCKICGLDEKLRRAIEKDIKLDLGVTFIVKKYPQANLNEGNVYTHKKHLVTVEAREVYDKALQEKVTKMEHDDEVVSKIDIINSPDKSNQEVVVYDTENAPPVKTLTEQMASNLTESGTTGNRVMDDVILLDTIIEQGERILEQVTPRDVLAAIKLKHDLLNGVTDPDTADKKIAIQMGVLLQQISEEEPNITIIAEASVEDI